MHAATEIEDINYTIVSLLNESCVAPAFCRLIFSRQGKNSRFIQVLDKNNSISSFIEYFYSSDNELMPSPEWKISEYHVGDRGVFAAEITQDNIIFGNFDQVYKQLLSENLIHNLLNEHPIFLSEAAHLAGDRHMELNCLNAAIRIETTNNSNDASAIVELFLMRDIETYFSKYLSSIISVYTDLELSRVVIQLLRDNKLETKRFQEEVIRWCTQDSLWKRFEILLASGEKQAVNRLEKVRSKKPETATTTYQPRLTGRFIAVAREVLRIAPNEMANILGIPLHKLRHIEQNKKSALSSKVRNKLENYMLSSGHNQEKIYRIYISNLNNDSNNLPELQSNTYKIGRGRALEESKLRIINWQVVGTVRNINEARQWFEQNISIYYIGSLNHGVWKFLFFNPHISWVFGKEKLRDVIDAIPRRVKEYISHGANIKHLEDEKFVVIYDQPRIVICVTDLETVVMGVIGLEENARKIRHKAREVLHWL